jgi:hypothetical protein
MVPLAADAGFTWMATDELILARTLDVTFSRDGSGHLEQPDRLYAPYVVNAGGARVACVFRDHVLSDLIGFTYGSWQADAAADDFVSRLAEAGRRFQDRNPGEEALITIILDGENAWEHFAGGGRPFLRALYGRLAAHPQLRTVTISEGCAGASRELAGIFPGSWIDGNFCIWIGHQDDQRAWSQLADARAALDETAGPATDLAAAQEEILVAEGSDWCWWYGDDHSSAHDLEFDDLFRRHLRNAYQFMGRPAPDELYVSNISRVAVGGQTEPTALLAPILDGEETSYFEWLGAGTYLVRDAGGAMHQADRPAPALSLVRFGCDRHRLFVRLDARTRIVDLLADGAELSLKFLAPAALRFSIRQADGGLQFGFWDRQAHPPFWSARGAGRAAVAVGTVLEAALPFDDIGVAEGGRMVFFVAVYAAGNVERERHPADRAIEVFAPDGLFEARHWRA